MREIAANPLGAAVLGLLVFVVITCIVRLFNHLVLVKHNVERAWADISVLLRQRQSELAKLVTVCQQYAGFEAAQLEGLTRARAEVSRALELQSAAQLGPAQRRLRGELVHVLATAEAHPQLRAHSGYTHLARRICDLETAIADRRAFYNESVRINNETVRSFPAVLLAMPFGLRCASFLEFDAGSLAPRDGGPSLAER